MSRKAWMIVKCALWFVEGVEWGAVVVISAVYGSTLVAMVGFFALLTAAMLTAYLG